MRRRPAVTILMLILAVILPLPLRAQLHGALGDVLGNRGDLDGAIAEELVATTSVLLVVGFWKDFGLAGHSTSTNPRQIVNRICRGYHVPRGKRVAAVSAFVGFSFADEPAANSKARRAAGV